MRLTLEIWEELRKYLSILDRANAAIPLSEKEALSSAIWGHILKDEKWIEMILAISNPGDPREPLPCILGPDLVKVAWGKTRGTYLVLVIKDLTGDCRQLRKAFFEGLKPHTYDKVKHEVYFPDSGITLHLGDALDGAEIIRIPDSKDLFHVRRKRLSTYVIYYGDDKIILSRMRQLVRCKEHPGRRNELWPKYAA